jgi:hypothetical protein
MKAKLIKEEISNFERTEEPLKKMGIGKNRFRKPGDQEIGDKVLIRNHPDKPCIILINKTNGKEMEIGLYAAGEVIGALKFILK